MLVRPTPLLLTSDLTVVATGAGGLAAVSQVYNSLKKHGKSLAKEDILIVDPAQYHYYQPGWYVKI